MVHNYQVSPYVGQRGESRTRSFLLPKQAAYHQAITLMLCKFRRLESNQ